MFAYTVDFLATALYMWGYRKATQTVLSGGGGGGGNSAIEMGT